MGIYSLEAKAYFTKAEQIRQRAAMDSVTRDLSELFSQVDLIPYGHCYLWKPALIWTHVTADSLIGICCVAIFIILCGFIKKIEDVDINTGVLFFSVFIGAVGLAHFMEVWNIWNADHWLAAGLKMFTALASVIACIYLYQSRAQFLDCAQSGKTLRTSEKQPESYFNLSHAFMGVCELEGKLIKHFNNNSEAVNLFRNSPDLFSRWAEYFKEAESSQQQQKFKHLQDSGGNKQIFAVSLSFIGRSQEGHSQFSFVAQEINAQSFK